VPGDFSAAAFALAAAAARPGSRVTARDVGLNPTRTGLLDALEAMGAGVTRERARTESGEPVGDVTVTGPDRLHAFDVPATWLPRMLDEVPAWTVAAAAAQGTSTISGAAELRVKESDRLAALATNLGRLGVTARETEDGLAVTGGPVRGGEVSSHGDHRIAMAFAALATTARGPVTVIDSGPIETSYPGFVSDFSGLGVEIDSGALAPRA
jgi:3-phosphoshikimate 1-carboxyvinyltransferase